MRKFIVLAAAAATVMLAGCGAEEEICFDHSNPVSVGMESESAVDKEEEMIVGYGQPAAEDALWLFSQRLLMENMEEQNPVLSPASAYLAMGMAGLGADGETLTEFQQVMGTGMHETARTIVSKASESGAFSQAEDKTQNINLQESRLKLNIANSVWMDEALKPADVWIQQLSSDYAAESFQLELSDNKAVQNINDWMANKTEGLIQGFLSEPLSEETRLALINTVYFYGQWEKAFKRSDTFKEDFNLENGSLQQVDFMHQYHTNQRYFAGEGFEGVILPYRDGDMAFVAIKPTAGQSVREMFGDLTREQISALLNVEETTFVNLKLPKFALEFDRALNNSLINMGIVKAFDKETADFSKMSSDGMKEFFISLVRQKAVIRVDEEGTEAAAATMVMVELCSSIESAEQPLELFFDEPFLYMIVDIETETPYFMGIMDNPGME